MKWLRPRSKKLRPDLGTQVQAFSASSAEDYRGAVALVRNALTVLALPVTRQRDYLATEHPTLGVEELSNLVEDVRCWAWVWQPLGEPRRVEAEDLLARLVGADVTDPDYNDVDSTGWSAVRANAADLLRLIDELPIDQNIPATPVTPEAGQAE